MPPKQRRLCDFYQRGHCSNGDNCKFLHARENEPARSTSTPKAPKKPKPPPSVAASQSSNSSHSPRQPGPAPRTPTAPAGRFVADLPRNTCRSYWETGQCDRGSNCKFEHTLRPQTPKSPSSVTANQSSNPPHFPRQPGPAPRTPTAPASRFVADLPRNTCRSYWETGQCDRGYDCKFEHKTRPQQSQPKGFSRSAPSISGVLIEEHLERFVSGFSDGFALHVFNPGQVHNKLKPFVQDGSEFRTAQEIYHFASILDSVHEFNYEWDFDGGQSFFEIVSDPSKEGIHRIQDILLHESVSSEAVNPGDLSFQRAFLPVLGYFSSRWVLRSTLRRNINALYGLLHHSFEDVERVLQSCISTCMENKSFSDSSTSVSGLRVFVTVTKCLFEYATHFKNAIAQHPCFENLVTNLVEWSEIWALAVCSSPPRFNDPITDWSSDSKLAVIERMKKSVDALFDVIARAEGSTVRRPETKPEVLERGPENQILLDKLELTYDGPGVHHEGGAPRHDNDEEDVSGIQVVPTHDELTCSDEPYLPANIPGARHHLPGDSMERLVDIQFRLLREELIAPIRISLLRILDDFHQPPKAKTQLNTLLEKGGGLYRASQSGADSVMFSVYTGVNFKNIDCDIRCGLAVNLTFDAPHGHARNPDPKKRVAYWESVGRKRLMQGGLIGLLWVSNDSTSTSQNVKFYIGTITSFADDLRKSASESPHTLALKVSFFDSEADVRILNALHERRPDEEGTKILIEAPIMFESIRPFLESLQSPERPPASVPFARYITHPDSGDLSTIDMDPPAYATPRFEYKLDCLFDPDYPVKLSLRPNDTSSVQQARDVLKAQSRLDPSQADAMVNVLTSEVSLIQGPPGTGKSFTGVELLRVMISSGVRPVLLIAFTNHALDNIIAHVLQKGITKKIVRLGARSADPTASQYTLENIMKMKPPSQADKAARQARQKVKGLQGSFSRLMSTVTAEIADESQCQEYLGQYFPDHFDALNTPPAWIQRLFDQSQGWQTVAGHGYGTHNLLDFWRNAKDLDFLTPPPEDNRQSDPAQGNARTGRARGRSRRFDELSVEDSDEEEEEGDLTEPEVEDWVTSMTTFFARLNIDGIPPIPASARNLRHLLDDSEVWSMSMEERQRIFEHWNNRIRELSWDDQKEEFNQLKNRHAEARKTLSQIVDRGKVELLSKADLIGCTTNGAAKLANLLKSVGPKVLLVEEAGQVLEAHVLASLVPSIEHLILIGDPLQLRPTIENYHLSMDHPKTGKIYRFDQSLMERLFKMGLPMSQLDVQRRMRPEIANLVRDKLYPSLKDHELVQSPPSIRGMARDVFFLDHRHAEESGGDDSASKTNVFEAKMIKDLVLYFLKQGKYTRSGDIVVLCAYLGQLAKVRKLLSNEVTTVIDERDAVQLINHEDNDEAAEILVDSTEQIQVSKRVLLRTVDNFQGEEGTIVILSLVRNSGENPKAGRKIGFLKSANRVNVALSRAREGLYILGNSEDLLASKSELWTSVIEQLKRNDQIGPAFPLSCSRHPNKVVEISKPGQISIHAPDGGCLEDCNSRLKCGHRCPLKCHPDDPQHRAVRCSGPCVKFCPRGHPCRKECEEACGDCDHSTSFPFPCGHVESVRCHQIDHPENLRCSYLVPRSLPHCGHLVVIACSDDASEVFCQLLCGRIMACCGHICSNQCGNCHAVNDEGAVMMHADHRCGKPLYCGHSCSGVCTANHNCADYPCQARCQQKCQHLACDQPCTSPCAPCMESCGWECEHQGSCPVVCGAPCARLPCDLRCDKNLRCGHRCPSVCGEPCDIQICPLCADDDTQNQVVDVIGGRQLFEIDPDGEELDSLLIALECGHVLTVESLDDICELKKYYTHTDGDWASIAPSPPGLQRPPTCPHCQAPIKSLRYGRIFKRADLDMSEQNVATSCQRALRLIQDRIIRFDITKALNDLEKGFANIPSGQLPAAGEQPEIELELRERKAIRATEPLPIPSKRFGKKSVAIRRLPKPIADLWMKCVRRLLGYYDEASQVASTKSSHVRAYEAAVATLYRQYLSELDYSGELRGTVTPEDMALGLAREHCGLPASPKADARFRLEACWQTFNIRFHMVTLAQKVAEILAKSRAAEKVRSLWADMIEDIIHTVERDASLAIEEARKSQSNRQLVRTVLFLMEARYQAFSHRADRYFDRKLLEKLKTEARDGFSWAKLTMQQYSRQFREAMDFNLSDQKWLKNNFNVPAEAIVAKWSDLVAHLEGSGSYSQVTSSETREIAKALMGGFLGIKTRGHFNQCPNGHAYDITEFGGATGESRCPECNSTIGGTMHSANPSNSRATNLENIGREEGMTESPWAWAA